MAQERISPAVVIIPVALGLVAVAVIGMAAMAKAAPPVEEYQCPICGQTFATYEELYSHFTTEHPAEPIQIIWE